MPHTRLLDDVEIRVLGALMEKEQTTPDYYPLTVKALVAACNQKSNRHPVTELGQDEVEAALERLREDVLAWRGEGGRAVRWSHCLDRRWHLEAAGKALMTLLMLRGPQTPGELRTRSERLHEADLHAVEATLRSLAGGANALVRELPRQPGQREARWVHLMSADGPGEVEGGAAPEDSAAATVPTAPAPPPATPAPAADSDLATRVERLEEEVASLAEAVRSLRRELGG